MGNFAVHHRIAKSLRTHWIVRVIAILYLTANSALFAQELVLRSSGIWQDRNQALTGDQLMLSEHVSWQPPVDHLLIDDVLWMKLELAAGEYALDKPFVVSLRDSVPIETTFYVYDPQGKPVNHSHMGSSVPIGEWDIARLEASHEFTPAQLGVYTVLIRIRNDRVTFLNFEIANNFVHDATLQRRSVIFGCAMGALAAFLIYNLILWRTLSRSIFLQFAGVIAVYALSTSHVSGAMAPLIAAISPRLSWIEAAIPCISSGCAMLFWNVFLKRFRYQNSGRLLNILAFSVLAVGAVAPFYPRLAVNILLVLRPVSYTLVMGMAILEAWRKQRAGVLLFVSMMPLYLLMVAWLPFGIGNDFLHVSAREVLPIIYVAQVLAIGIGLTEGISELRQRLIAALNNRVDAMEKLIKQRTAEVENANKTLKTEIAIRRDAEEKAINQSRKIQDAQAQLLSSSRLRALGEMATGISHEINNPLTILKGYLYLIGNAVQTGDVPSEKIGELCSKAMVTADRMVSVVKGLREFAVQDARDDATVVNVRKSWDITVNLLREKMAHTGVKCNLSDFSNDLAVWVRAADFTQTLLSLLNVAIEAAAECAERWVHVKIEGNDMSVTIAICHSGAKMSSEYADQIFTPFFVNMNGPNIRSLELSIVKQLMSSVGGDIRLVPDAEYTTFEIVLRRVYEISDKAPGSAIDKTA